MLVFDNRFQYPKLERIDSPDGRKYTTPSGQALASVTTILQATKSEESKDKLEKWQKRVGLEEAENIKNGAANLGTIIHNNLEKFMKGQEIVWGTNYIYKMAKAMTETIIEQGLSKLQCVYGLECALYLEELYAGTADLIAGIDNEIVIADFKNTIKMKKEEWIEDYFVQTVAYALAHNQMFGTNIKRGRIMMVARPNDMWKCEYKEFDLDPIKFSKYEDIWLAKLEQFYANK